jgi:heme A synthase
MKLVTLFRITAGLILVQIALGGLVTFNFISPIFHMIWGFVVFAIAISTSVVTLRSKPTDGGLRGVAAGIIVALIAQVALGFSVLALSNDLLAWVHLLLGVIIYAMALTGMGFAQRQDIMSTRMADPRS